MFMYHIYEIMVDQILLVLLLIQILIYVLEMSETIVYNMRLGKDLTLLPWKSAHQVIKVNNL